MNEYELLNTALVFGLFVGGIVLLLVWAIHR